MIRTPGAPFARLSAGAFATVAILFTWAAPLAHAQASRCDASLHGFCFNVQLASCPTVNRVCGYDDGSVGFVCACRPACTNSQSCNADEACFKGNCNAHVACNNATDCVTSGIADAACSSDGVCVKAPPPPPPGCTADASLCRTDNACSGTRSCDAASGSCVTGPPVSCPQPGPVIERAPDGTFVIVGQHAHCEPVPGSATGTTCITTKDAPPPPRLCPSDPVDNPNLVFTPTGVDLVPFKYTATLRDMTYKAGAQPQVLYIRLANARGADAVLASTAPAGKADGSDWHYDRSDRAWHWIRKDAASPIESVTVKPLGGQRVRVQVVGGARVTNASFTPAKGPLAPPSPKTILYAIETGIGWAERSRLDLQRIQPSCTVVVGDCQRSASGGLNCHVPGWKAGGKG